MKENVGMSKSKKDASQVEMLLAQEVNIGPKLTNQTFPYNPINVSIYINLRKMTKRRYRICTNLHNMYKFTPV